METKNLMVYPCGTMCYIGEKKDDGHRNIKGEIDHIRLFKDDVIMYSVRFWKDGDPQYYLGFENEIDFREATKNKIGFETRS